MPKQITFDETARRALERGVDQLTALGVARDHQVKAPKWAGFGLPRLSV